MLENYTPRVMRKWGLNYDELKKIKPSLIMLSNTGYGSSGPWSAFPSQGTTLEATMGVTFYTGYEGDKPWKVGQSYPDFIACWAGMNALWAAIVEKAVAIDKSRQALFGHSLGGLFVLDVLFTHSDAFDTYIAGSPSIWWGKREILNLVPAFEAAQKKSGARRRLLIEVGELEQKVTPEDLEVAKVLQITPEELARLQVDARMVDNAAELAARLKPLSASGLDVDYVMFSQESHNSVIPAYLSRGAQFSLRGWKNRGDKAPR